VKDHKTPENDDKGVIMKMDTNSFYVLDAGKDKWIFTSKTEAIDQMKVVVKNGDGDATKLLSINTSEDNWEITQVPWKLIALELIKERG
jgi:hypothetical protein